MSDLNEWKNQYLSHSRLGKQQTHLDKISHKKLLTPRQASEVIDRSVNVQLAGSPKKMEDTSSNRKGSLAATEGAEVCKS